MQHGRAPKPVRLEITWVTILKVLLGILFAFCAVKLWPVVNASRGNSAGGGSLSDRQLELRQILAKMGRDFARHNGVAFGDRRLLRVIGTHRRS